MRVTRLVRVAREGEEPLEGASTEIAHRLEVATSFREVGRGLLGRSNLPVGEGMLLEGCWNIHMFFMRIPLDVVYIDIENRVKKVVPHLKPWRVSACPGANSTIELGVGTIERHEIAPGDRLRILAADDASEERNA